MTARGRALAALALVLAAGCAPVTTTSPPPASTPAPATPPPSSPTSPPTTAPAPEPIPAPPAIVEAQLPGGEPVLDIGLSWDVDTTRVSFTGTMPFEVTGATHASHVAGGPVELRVSGTQVIVRPRDKKRAVPLLVLRAGDTLWIGGADLTTGDQARIRWNGGTYRGRFKVFLNARRKLTLATRLELEPYLKGVVPGEIGALSDSLLEAGRAQAIAARSYTLFYKGRRGEEGFDLYATVEDQVYGSIEGERSLATRCVESTNGLVGLWRDVPIRANYSSTCGGISAEAWEAWPTESYGYLSSHPDGVESDHCAASPHFRWREEWPARDFAANLAKYGPSFGVPLPAGGVGEVVDVNVVQRSRSGRVWWLDVETTTGHIRIHAHSMRQVLRRSTNANAILRSNLFKIAVRRDPATRRAISVVASGAGSGHGVGLCQTGALGMAKRGTSGEAILAHYYPGATLSRLY